MNASMIRITAIRKSVLSAGADGASLDGAEQIPLDRTDLQRCRLRTVSDRGTDVGIDLPPGTTLQHGDLVEGDGRIMVIRQNPEVVGVVRPRPGAGRIPAGTMALVAHAIGNMHRPISVTDDMVVFPVQARSEAETFRAIMDGIGPSLLEVTLEEMVFVPHRAADVRGHG